MARFAHPPCPTAERPCSQLQALQRLPAFADRRACLFHSERLARCESKEAQQRAAAVRLLIRWAAAGGALAGLGKPHVTAQHPCQLSFNRTLWPHGASIPQQAKPVNRALPRSFMGAAQGWLYSAWDFLEQCTECYRSGRPQGAGHWVRDGAVAMEATDGDLPAALALAGHVPAWRALRLTPSPCPCLCPLLCPNSNGWTADDVFNRLNDEEFAQVPPFTFPWFAAAVCSLHSGSALRLILQA